MKKAKYITISLFIIFLSILFYIYKVYFFIDKNEETWTVGYGSISKLEDIDSIIENKLLIKDIQSDSTFNFIADPFIFKDSTGIYIFVEQFIKENGDISVFYSKDTINLKFKYLGIALDEDFHLSYPQVYTYNKQIYMLPETQKSGKVILYKSVNFPLKWERYNELLNYNNIKDPTILQLNNKIYLFGCQKGKLYCWISNNFLSDFKRIENVLLLGTESRPGGRIFNYNNKIIMPIQNSSKGYGTGLSLYEIKIDNNDKIKMKPYKKWYLRPHEKSIYFSQGMHHFDVIDINSNLFVVYDGHSKINDKK